MEHTWYDTARTVGRRRFQTETRSANCFYCLAKSALGLHQLHQSSARLTELSVFVGDAGKCECSVPSLTSYNGS